MGCPKKDRCWRHNHIEDCDTVFRNPPYNKYDGRVECGYYVKDQDSEKPSDATSI